MSENSSEMSERDSRIARASSALTACTAVKPASSTISTARIRNTISSSTTRTFVAGTGGGEDVVGLEDMTWDFLSGKGRHLIASYCEIDLFTRTRRFLSRRGQD